MISARCRATATASRPEPFEHGHGALAAQLALPGSVHRCVMSTAPPQDLLQHQVLLNIKLLKPAPLSLLLAIACCCQRRGCAAARRPARLHLLRRSFDGGAGLGTTSSAQALVHGLEAPPGGWPGCRRFRADPQPSVPPPAGLVRRMGCSSKAISAGAEVLAQGQGGLLDVAVIPIFERQPFIYLSYAAGGVAPTAPAGGARPLNGHSLSDLEVIYCVCPEQAREKSPAFSAPACSGFPTQPAGVDRRWRQPPLPTRSVR